MKKLLSLFTAAAVLLSGFCAFAADESSGLMEKSLAEVKERIEIPEDYTEFSADTYSYDETIYEFTWQDKDGEKSLSVEADGDGNIHSYRNYIPRSSYDFDTITLAKYSKTEASDFAEKELKKLMPSAFGENDTLKQSRIDYNSYMPSYDVSYERYYNDIKAADEYANITIRFDDEGNMYLFSLNTSYNYNASFEKEGEELEDLTNAYKELSPSTLRYDISYSYENGKQEQNVKLNYVNDNKLMSVYTGEEWERSYPISRYSAGGSAMNTEAAADKGSNLKQFSEQELNKLQENAGLKKPEEILQSLKKIKILKFSDDVTAESYNIYDDNGEYYITLWLSNDYSVTANAKTGELISVYGGLYIMEASAGANTVLEDEETADARIAEFLKSYSPKSGEYRETERNTSDNVLTIIYTRYVNDIVCPNDSIYISYNLASEQLERYNISYSEKAVFPKPDGIISADDAFDIMFEKNGLQKEYVCVNDKNEYKLCVLFELSYDIDAFTGKSAYDDDSSWPYEHNSYTDIIGHWCETAAKTLEDSGIAFNGSLLKPDEAITQEDLLRLVRVKADSYSMTCTPEVLYTILEDIEPLEEDSAASGVTRETACMYFARALNIYKYTADGNMFNLPFSDADKISKNKAGSVALLASAGVIGNSGSFRPKDYITYAEAVTILYNILKAGL